MKITAIVWKGIAVRRDLTKYVTNQLKSSERNKGKEGR
jgi:hypothetical protein